MNLRQSNMAVQDSLRGVRESRQLRKHCLLFILHMAPSDSESPSSEGTYLKAYIIILSNLMNISIWWLHASSVVAGQYP